VILASRRLHSPTEPAQDWQWASATMCSWSLWCQLSARWCHCACRWSQQRVWLAGLQGAPLCFSLLPPSASICLYCTKQVRIATGCGHQGDASTHARRREPSAVCNHRRQHSGLVHLRYVHRQSGAHEPMNQACGLLRCCTRGFEMLLLCVTTTRAPLQASSSTTPS
jgi:hypothetical protein